MRCRVINDDESFVRNSCCLAKDSLEIWITLISSSYEGFSSGGGDKDDDDDEDA